MDFGEDTEKEEGSRAQWLTELRGGQSHWEKQDATEQTRTNLLVDCKPHCVLTVILTKRHTHHLRRRDSSRDSHERPTSGQWPNSWKPPLLPQIVRIFLLLVSMWRYPAQKTNHPDTPSLLSLSETDQILPLECVPQNKPAFTFIWLAPEFFPT